jgi:lipopolysaccharide export system protein LptC
MMLNRRNWVVGLSTLALALGTWWLRQGTVEDRRGRTPLPPHTPDYWVEQLDTWETDPAGHPRRRLIAERLEHFPDDQSTLLDRPQLLLLEPGRPPWRLRAERGWVSPDGDLVLLQGEVHIDREAADDTLPIHLVTRDLRVQPEDEYAETEQAVRATSGPHRLDSTGLQAWLRPPVRIKLLANVRGHYEVTP